jgi:Fe-S cluster assembly iron-binding protein IscA
MKSNRLFKFLFAVSFLTVCSAFSLNAQIAKTNEETEVPVIKKIGSSRFECRFREDAVIDEEKFEKIVADKQCSYLKDTLKVDFTKQTLIGFHIRGDCFVSAAAKVFRSDETKKYKVRIKNIRGGCRAGGSFQGWLIIEKIPAGFAVEFEETRVDGRNELGDSEFSFLGLEKSTENKAAETLGIRSIDLKGCIHTSRSQQFVIKDNETYLKTIRADASLDWCLKKLEKIDFGKHTLLGIEINSGYCGIPLGLQYQAVKDADKKQYLLDISYIDPQGAVCRALSQYDLWLLVPKLPAGYEVKFEVKAR